jgi:hypothetical protein
MEEILEAVGLELGNLVAIRRRDRSRTLDEPSSQEVRA